MNEKPSKSVRCAVYTRVSTDQGLEQDFSSLDAQREAAEAYIKSQAHANWTLIDTAYNDGGYSGGNTDRPALTRLLDDVKARALDVIVVYKVDRLTRSLADFAKLVELFDANGVSFVSVTQHFNTTNSMGRLTLNVLLSFAQFEREVTSERIRDKIAASKRKGIWVGGNLPLGYALKGKQVVVLEKEARLVRHIFGRYAALGSVNKLMVELRSDGATSKTRKLKSGRLTGGVPFTRGPLYYLLRNRFYIGEVVYKREKLPGPQPAIVDRALFDRVQEGLQQGQNNATPKRSNSNAPLTGLIFDDRGNRMSPSHTRKQGRRYQYYVSVPTLHGQPKPAGTINRVPANEIEATVAAAVRKLFALRVSEKTADVVRQRVRRIDVQKAKLVVTVAEGPTTNAKKRAITIPWDKPATKQRREILVPSTKEPGSARAIRSEPRARLVAAIARGHAWLDELVSEEARSVEEIAKREKCTVRKVNMTIALAFVSPTLVSAAIQGKLPRGIGIRELSELPSDWRAQNIRLGLAS